MLNIIKKRKEKNKSKELKKLLIKEIDSILDLTYVLSSISFNKDLFNIKNKLDDNKLMINDKQYELILNCLRVIRNNIKDPNFTILNNKINRIHEYLVADVNSLTKEELFKRDTEDKIIQSEEQAEEFRACLEIENKKGLELKKKIEQAKTERDSFINISEIDYISMNKKVLELEKQLSKVNRSILSYKNRLNMIESSVKQLSDIDQTVKDGIIFKNCINLIKEVEQQATFFDLDSLKSDALEFKSINEKITSDSKEMTDLLNGVSSNNEEIYEDDDSLAYKKACEQHALMESKIIPSIDNKKLEKNTK